MQGLAARVASVVRDVPDFPRPGILFKDITPVLADAGLYGEVTAWMGEGWGSIDKIVAMESRGFLFAPALIGPLDAGLALARKGGKLPYQTTEVSYQLEYGTATLEMHIDAVAPGERVLVIDDLLATGGTAAATVRLVRELGGEVVGCCFLIELSFLSGRQQLDVPVRSLVSVP
ncbi:MAG TPA: adenine phosphoribosyltransferase [Deltaproteobacteria bacterium]|nr:adenine phosphoribosyltransferase [Deltaproteobacteria bacterium]